MLLKTRIINGVYYVPDSGYRTKTEAKQYAARLRKEGERVRIFKLSPTKDGRTYWVYATQVRMMRKSKRGGK
ncbi:MAG: hypothetical protein PHQ43_00815 [Dehalococcoidales bacterium]|nr:hypothetical protein [Dehalococcoidales bacterium]